MAFSLPARNFLVFLVYSAILGDHSDQLFVLNNCAELCVASDLWCSNSS